MHLYFLRLKMWKKREYHAQIIVVNLLSLYMSYLAGLGLNLNLGVMLFNFNKRNC